MEPTAVVIFGFALSVTFNWPIVRHPRGTIAADLGDPLLQAWQLAWQHHFLTTDSGFWTANFFHPSTNSVAFTDTLLGYLPLSLFGEGPVAAVLRYNIAFVFACALAFIGAYALVRQLGSNWQGAALAGVVFAWAPWRLAHDSHLNILSTGGIALALFALARGHGYTLRTGFQRDLAQPGWIIAGWLIACWQISLGFATGLAFAYVLGIVCLTAALCLLFRRITLGRRLIIVNAIGGAVFLTVTYLFARPYLHVADQYGFSRSLDELRYFSPPPEGLVAVTDRSWLWQGTVFDQEFPDVLEKAVFPGLTITILALVGIFFSAWPRRIRFGLALAAVLTTILSLGPHFFGGSFTYLLLWEYLPGWNGMRTPGRLVLWVILVMTVLAAGAITKMAQEWRAWGRKLGALTTAALAVPALFALAEGFPDRPYVTTPAVPVALAEQFDQARGAIAVLPMSPLANLRYLYWSTDGFPPLVNGESGWHPPPYLEMADATTSFPNQHSVELLRRNGVSVVVALRADIRGTPYETAVLRPVSGLGITKVEHPDAVVFILDER
ncbi:MAG: hypothetical protein M3443_10540 [Actinomycetota bacterium]|nr:hypothetical protein [Actinomycetota bacterium]